MWYIKNFNNTISLYLKVSANAKNNKFLGIIEGEKPQRLKLAIKAPPLNGAANKELIAFLSKTFNLSKNSFNITKGLAANKKTVTIVTNNSNQLINQVNLILKENYEQSHQLPLL